uniref:Uncharacterized protein n=1 Tax=Timema monikensis TaxID=170555 RepID=A0A7R9ECD7_9NEOP|nr:unnamed protein product [Timema monikensis]
MDEDEFEEGEIKDDSLEDLSSDENDFPLSKSSESDYFERKEHQDTRKISSYLNLQPCSKPRHVEDSDITLPLQFPALEMESVLQLVEVGFM